MIPLVEKLIALADCGCDPARKLEVTSNPPNSGNRWRACGESNCGALLAQEMRELVKKEMGHE